MTHSIFFFFSHLSKSFFTTIGQKQCISTKIKRSYWFNNNSFCYSLKKFDMFTITIADCTDSLCFFVGETLQHLPHTRPTNTLQIPLHQRSRQPIPCIKHQRCIFYYNTPSLRKKSRGECKCSI